MKIVIATFLLVLGIASVTPAIAVTVQFPPSQIVRLSAEGPAQTIDLFFMTQTRGRSRLLARIFGASTPTYRTTVPASSRNASATRKPWRIRTIVSFWGCLFCREAGLSSERLLARYLVVDTRRGPVTASLFPKWPVSRRPEPTAQNSPLVAPLPGTFLLLASALVLMVVLGSRRRLARALQPIIGALRPPAPMLIGRPAGRPTR